MAKNRTIMRGDLRLDLKDAAATWSNAELNRCIEKSTADLSRFLPDEKVYEKSLQFTVTDESVTTPIDTDADRIVDAADISAFAAGSTCTIAASPDVPRPVTWALTDGNSSITTMTIIVKGIDENEESVTETFHYAPPATKSGTGKQYFKVVHEVEVDQIAGNGSGDVLDIGVAAYTDDWVYLANKPIRWDSETITNSAGTTTYTRDTDYDLDYTNGRIKAISGGSITAAQSLLADYTKSKISIDLSSLAGFVRIFDVEYPVGQVPQEFQTPDTWSKVITLGGFANESQEEVSEDKHISVRYYAEHNAPTDSAPGSYPSFLDWTVELAASAYALFIFAVKYEHQVVTDLGLAATALGNIAAIHTLTGTALGKVTTYAADADTALDAAIVQAAAAASALAKVTTYLENNTNEDAKYWLTKITTDIADLRTAIKTALDACSAYLNEVGAATTGDLDLAEAVWTEEVKHILTASGIPNAKDFLEVGDGLINLVNVGSEVPELNRRYAETALNMAEKWAAKRQDFLSEAGRRTDAAMGYVAEAVQRLSNLRSYIEQAAGWGAVASGFVDEATQRATAAQVYVNEANGRLGMCRAFTDEANGRIAEIDRYLAEAASYQASAAAYDGLATRFREEAIERRNEAWSIWRDPKAYIGQFVTSSVRQTT